MFTLTLAGDPWRQQITDDARGWISDCVWADMDPEAIEALSDAAVINGIERHYCGGLVEFIRDAGY